MATFTAFSSFIQITIGDKTIPFVSNWSWTQTRASGMLVYTVSNSATAVGAAEQQIAWTLSVELPEDVSGQNLVDINNIAIGDGTQITAVLNRPSANNDTLSFTGDQYIFTNIVPQTQSGNISEGSIARRTLSFYAGNMSMIPASA